MSEPRTHHHSEGYEEQPWPTREQSKALTATTPLEKAGIILATVVVGWLVVLVLLVPSVYLWRWLF